MQYCSNIKGSHPLVSFFQHSTKYHYQGVIVFPSCQLGLSFLEETMAGEENKQERGLWHKRRLDSTKSTLYFKGATLLSPKTNLPPKSRLLLSKTHHETSQSQRCIQCDGGLTRASHFPSASHPRGFWCSWLFLMKNVLIIDMCGRASEPNKTLSFPLHCRPITIIVLSRCLPNYQADYL